MNRIKEHLLENGGIGNKQENGPKAEKDMTNKTRQKN